MKTDRILACHQRCKEMTRLRKGSAPGRLIAGLVAGLTSRRMALVYKRFRPELPPPLSGEGRAVISLTSFPARIGNLWMVVDLLMRQSVLPAEILLTLYEGEFPDRRLPDSLSPYLERGLKVLWSGENLMPHLKYFEAFRREASGRGRLVVTADDDLFYAPDFLERLLRLHEAHPGAVCANIARRIVGDNYSAWEDVYYPEGPSGDLLALGFGGVLYPPEFYRFGGIYDIPSIKSVCLRADDLWLKDRQMACGVEVVTGPFFAVPAELPSSQKVSLSVENVRHRGNDIVWKKLKSL